MQEANKSCCCPDQTQALVAETDAGDVCCRECNMLLYRGLDIFKDHLVHELQPNESLEEFSPDCSRPVGEGRCHDRQKDATRLDDRVGKPHFYLGKNVFITTGPYKTSVGYVKVRSLRQTLFFRRLTFFFFRRSDSQWPLWF